MILLNNDYLLKSSMISAQMRIAGRLHMHVDDVSAGIELRDSGKLVPSFSVNQDKIPEIPQDAIKEVISRVWVLEIKPTLEMRMSGLSQGRVPEEAGSGDDYSTARAKLFVRTMLLGFALAGILAGVAVALS